MRLILTTYTCLALLLLTHAKKSKQKQRDLANLSDEEIERMLDEMDDDDDDDNIVINKNPKPLKEPYKEPQQTSSSTKTPVVHNAKKKRDSRFEGLSDRQFHKLDDDWDDEDIQNGLVDDADLPEHKRPQVQPDMDVIMKNPKLLDQPTVNMVKEQKRHRTLMMFIDVVEADWWNAKDNKKKPYSTEKFAGEISERWESMLHNAHELGITRFQPADDQILMKLDDGSRAYAIKDFLIQQPECVKVNIEKTDYWGEGNKLVRHDLVQAKEEAKKAAKQAKEDAKKKKDEL